MFFGVFGVFGVLFGCCWCFCVNLKVYKSTGGTASKQPNEERLSRCRRATSYTLLVFYDFLWFSVEFGGFLLLPIVIS